MFMKDLELNPHKINFEMMAREWREFQVLHPVALSDTRSQASEFGEVRPSVSEIERHVQNLRDKAVDQGYGRYFRIRRLKFGSTRSHSHHNQGLETSSSSQSAFNSGTGLKEEQEEDGNNLEDGNTLVVDQSTTETSKNHRNTSSQTDSPNSNIGPNELPELEASTGAKDNDHMQLRSISRSNYQGYDAGTHHNEDEYDPVVERVSQEWKEVQREHRRQRAMSAIQPQAT
jgi:hypothetical protein